jgi:hypothetical protein
MFLQWVSHWNQLIRKTSVFKLPHKSLTAHKLLSAIFLPNLLVLHIQLSLPLFTSNTHAHRSPCRSRSRTFLLPQLYLHSAIKTITKTYERYKTIYEQFSVLWFPLYDNYAISYALWVCLCLTRKTAKKFNKIARKSFAELQVELRYKTFMYVSKHFA